MICGPALFLALSLAGTDGMVVVTSEPSKERWPDNRNIGDAQFKYVADWRQKHPHETFESMVIGKQRQQIPVDEIYSNHEITRNFKEGGVLRVIPSSSATQTGFELWHVDHWFYRTCEVAQDAEKILSTVWTGTVISLGVQTEANVLTTVMSSVKGAISAFLTGGEAQQTIKETEQDVDQLEKKLKKDNQKLGVNLISHVADMMITIFRYFLMPAFLTALGLVVDPNVVKVIFDVLNGVRAAFTDYVKNGKIDGASMRKCLWVVFKTLVPLIGNAVLPGLLTALLMPWSGAAIVGLAVSTLGMRLLSWLMNTLETDYVRNVAVDTANGFKESLFDILMSATAAAAAAYMDVKVQGIEAARQTAETIQDAVTDASKLAEQLYDEFTEHAAAISRDCNANFQFTKELAKEFVVNGNDKEYKKELAKELKDKAIEAATKKVFAWGESLTAIAKNYLAN